jgi:glucose/arabinose dehydrogenase
MLFCSILFLPYPGIDGSHNTPLMETLPVQDRAAIALVALLVLTAGPARAEQSNAPSPAVRARFAVTTVASGLENPWALAFLPDGRMLVTERPGRLRLVARDGRLSPPVIGVPPVAATGQGGLLDIALDPKFAETRLVYISFAEPRSDGGNGTSVARGRLVEGGSEVRLEGLTIIFRQQPASRGGLHFGSRLAFGRDGTLFVTLGERYQKEFAQDLGRHWGKVVRIRADGSVPADNPFLGRAGALPEIWSYGHRNAQSAAIHPESGKLWTVEHGARGGDEVNIPARGRNYGWPLITYGRDYSGAKIGGGTSGAGLEQPVYYWDPSIAPSGMAFYSADLMPEWKGSLFVGALAGQHLTRLVLAGERVVGEEKLLVDLSERIRDVRQGPDGALYVLTDSTSGRVLRLAPLR